jgi:glutamate synthase domain-containing protein 2
MQTGTQTTFRVGIAMNRLGGKSNTGEGGEDADRYYTDDIQSSRCLEQTRRQIKRRGGRRGRRQVLHRRHSE